MTSQVHVIPKPRNQRRRQGVSASLGHRRPKVWTGQREAVLCGHLRDEQEDHGEFTRMERRAEDLLRTGMWLAAAGLTLVSHTLLLFTGSSRVTL